MMETAQNFTFPKNTIFYWFRKLSCNV